jgi:hypothetical protein
MIAELERLNETWTKAWFDKDDRTIENLAASDYLYICPNGQMLDRAGLLGIIRSPSYRLHHGGRTEVSIKPLGSEAGVIVFRWQGEASLEGKTFKDDHRCTMVCVRKPTGWQVVLETCTPNGPVVGGNAE